MATGAGTIATQGAEGSAPHRRALKARGRVCGPASWPARSARWRPPAGLGSDQAWPTASQRHRDRRLAAVKALIEEGHPADTPIAYLEKDATPLFKAAGEGRTEIVRYLIGRGANVNYRGAEWGHTPLSQAAGGGFDDVVDILIKAGADPKVKDRNGNTAFAVAALGGQFDLAEMRQVSDVSGADSRQPSSWPPRPRRDRAIRWLAQGRRRERSATDTGRTALIDAAAWAPWNRRARCWSGGKGSSQMRTADGPLPRPKAQHPTRS